MKMFKIFFIIILITVAFIGGIFTCGAMHRHKTDIDNSGYEVIVEEKDDETIIVIRPKK